MKKLQITIHLAIIAIIGLIPLQIVESQSRTEDILLNEAERITKDQFTFSTKTPKGVSIYSVNKTNYKMLTAIDQGITDLIAVAKKNGYSKRLKYSDYTVFIAKADRTKDSQNRYSPDIAVSAGQYAGSDYDQGGYIYAAGMVLAYTPGAFIIAEHTKDFQRVSNVVRYEGEHIVLYHNDRKLYRETADHSKGGGHPILH
ncbi:MAG: hypothetical protein R2747_07870 [Pyrinomonadaceae bacterium]